MTNAQSVLNTLVGSRGERSFFFINGSPDVTEFGDGGFPFGVPFSPNP